MAVYPILTSPYTYGAGILGGDTENKQELWCRVMTRAREEKQREGAGSQERDGATPGSGGFLGRDPLNEYPKGDI